LAAVGVTTTAATTGGLSGGLGRLALGSLRVLRLLLVGVVLTVAEEVVGRAAARRTLATAAAACLGLLRGLVGSVSEDVVRLAAVGAAAASATDRLLLVVVLALALVVAAHDSGHITTAEVAAVGVRLADGGALTEHITLILGQARVAGVEVRHGWRLR